MNRKIILFFVLLISGCSLVKSSNVPAQNFEGLVATEVANQFLTETVQSQQQTESDIPPTLTFAIKPTIVPTTALTPTQTQVAGRQICVQERPGIVLDFDPSLTTQAVLLNALNDGISLTSLNQQLKDLNRASGMVPAVQLDFNQDQFFDIAIAVVEPNPEAVLFSADVFIYFCNQQQYDFVHVIHPPEEGLAAKIFYAQNLDRYNGDELIMGSEFCGAHSCFTAFEIWSWGSSGFRNRMIGQSNDLPFPDIYLRDGDHDQIYDIEVQYGSAGSVGAGPGRGVTRTWAYQSGTQTWHVSNEQYSPSSYRIHVIHDADDATSAGNYDLARDLYLNVITNDPNLEDWMNPEAEQANLNAYAYYRLVVLYRITGQEDLSNQWLADIQTDFPVGEVGHAYVDLADVFVNGFDFGGIVDGCQAAALYAGAHMDEILNPLGSQAFGYGNWDYEPTHMCP